MKFLVAAIIYTQLLIAAPAAEERIVRSLSLPFASLEQEVIYNPSRREYETARDDILARLKKGDNLARMNPASGPWLRAVTTARVGFEIRGVGATEGRTNYRQVSAAEEALYLFENTP